ncbi:MAG: choice-of-anchor O protein, partial [Pseudomonadota bacterium]|nr:choice-of-anchor O protein [Pseudomonadota bacterium]
YGDSDKPNISNGGSNIMVTWTDKYCDALPGDAPPVDALPGDALPGDADGETNQRTVSYVTRNNREVPFSCTYGRYATVSGAGGITWGTDPVQLSDGSRDAKQDVSKVNSLGKSVVTWQEDPQGLMIGGGDGPGHGASGATANHGTDIWFTTATQLNTKFDDTVVPPKAIAGKTTGFTNVARLTDNATAELSGGHPTVKDKDGDPVDGADIDSGQTSATRANTGLVGPTIVVAYEETKGSEEIEIGKYIRYHSFPYTLDPSALADDSDDGVSGQSGCLISNPEENARRVRFVPQATPGSSGLQMGVFWKEGKYDGGGPSDIVTRLLRNGVSHTNMSPAVAANCETSLYAETSTLANQPALNLSSNTKTGGNLSDTTETNNVENALAHRGAIVGDDMYIGYTYTSDWALATYTTLENHDFWLRHYNGATDTWTAPKNISNLPTLDLNVREPRFVKTPFSDDPAQNYNPEAFIIAWGTQTNVASHLEDPSDVDIFYTRSFDKGVTMEPIVRIDNPDASGRFESQLRPTPDAQTLYGVWNEEKADGSVNAMFSKAVSGEVTGDDPYSFLASLNDGDDTTVAAASTSGGSAGVFDGVLMPALIGLFMGMVGFLGLRKIQK